MENLGIDLKLLIAQLINFAILFFLFSRYMAKPFLKYLNGEKQKDEENNRITLELQAKHERMLEEEKKWRKKMKREQDKLLEETKKAAAKLREELIKEAKADADDVVLKANRQIEEEKEKFYKDVKKYVADVSISMIEKALKSHLTGDVQKKLTDYVLTNLQNERKML